MVFRENVLLENIFLGKGLEGYANANGSLAHIVTHIRSDTKFLSTIRL